MVVGMAGALVAGRTGALVAGMVGIGSAAGEF